MAFKERIPDISVGAVVGALVPALISLNIFSTRAELAEYKAEVAEKYMQKNEVESKLDRLDQKITKLIERFDDYRAGGRK